MDFFYIYLTGMIVGVAIMLVLIALVNRLIEAQPKMQFTEDEMADLTELKRLYIETEEIQR